MHKEQNDQIQESDAGASVRVSGQNWPCAAVCSMSTILLPGHWCHLAGNGETVIVPFNPTRWRHQCLEFNVCVSQKQEPRLLFVLKMGIDMHENMLFKYINRIEKPRSTSEAIVGHENSPNLSIQPLMLRFSGCTDGRGPY